jgi:enamine deaminase RidA (YjgF/YER057c/UK114 family)
MIFLGGRRFIEKQRRAVNPGKLGPQTKQAMVHIGTILKELGAGYSDVCKVTTVYEGRGGGDDLHENLAIRSSFFPDPGPATTGIPLPILAYPEMVIEIDVFAMTEPD